MYEHRCAGRKVKRGGGWTDGRLSGTGLAVDIKKHGTPQVYGMRKDLSPWTKEKRAVLSNDYRPGQMLISLELQLSWQRGSALLPPSQTPALFLGWQAGIPYSITKQPTTLILH